MYLLFAWVLGLMLPDDWPEFTLHGAKDPGTVRGEAFKFKKVKLYRKLILE